MKQIFFFAFLFLLVFFLGCASHSEAGRTPVETPLKALPNTVSKELPYRCDSVAPHQEIRRVSVKDSNALPTLSALDFAAYYKNPIREAGKQERPEKVTPLPSNFSSEGFPMLDSVLFSEPEFLFPERYFSISRMGASTNASFVLHENCLKAEMPSA